MTKTTISNKPPDTRLQNIINELIHHFEMEEQAKPQQNALLENVAIDATAMLDIPEGRIFHPGQAIESAWMIMEIARNRGNQSLLNTAVEIILASLEHGCDRECGGLKYITHIDWSPTYGLGTNLKLWWPHCKALHALLPGWAPTRRGYLRNWYEKVHDYAFARFPDTEYGEWYGYLDRNEQPVRTAKATAWKCFFHFSRALSRCYTLLKGLTAGRPKISHTCGF